MTNKELFVNAFIEAEKIEYAGYLDKSFFTFEFSPKFEKKMSKLVSKEHLIKFSTRRKISKSLIAAVVAIIVMFTGLMSVSASRDKVLEFVEKIFSDHIEIKPDNEYDSYIDSIETPYIITNVPADFKLVKYDLSDTGVIALWQDNEKNEIVFKQDILSGDFSVDNENNMETTEINGYKAYVYWDDTTSGISWSNGEYWFRIKTNVQYKNLLVSMAKNISKKL